MKKSTLAILTIALTALAAPSFASSGKAPTPNSGQGQMTIDTQDSNAVYDTFMADTTKLRQKLTASVTEYVAAMESGSPDTKRINKLARKIKKLRRELYKKALAAGISEVMLPQEYSTPILKKSSD